MFSKEQVDMLVKKAMSQLGREEPPESKKDKNNKKCLPDLNTSQILVIIALLGGVLDVNSFLVDKNQDIQIVLTGTLKQKTQLEKVMEQVGKRPFDEVMKAMLGK